MYLYARYKTRGYILNSVVPYTVGVVIHYEHGISKEISLCRTQANAEKHIKTLTNNPPPQFLSAHMVNVIEINKGLFDHLAKDARKAINGRRYLEYGE